ncbi:protein of unknown function [Agrobacterium pusense]|uniref:Uncharacterized protein n=1 Tax=Agrobacterium pusense TaxID=648995 RepID=U4QAZ9_9HYPH|nr:protein of unknown function [Agrobacterium pusense]
MTSPTRYCGEQKLNHEESAIRIRFVRRLFRSRIDFIFAGFFFLVQLSESKWKISLTGRLVALCG